MEQAAARELFDENAETYDRVNSIISLGLDSRWYSWAARQASVAGRCVLDAFAGTGAVGVRAAGLGADVTLADASARMLAHARRRAALRGVTVRTALADLTSPHLAIPGAPFDAVSVMWGLRYVDDPRAILRSLSGQMRSGGRMVVVEFVEPGSGLLARLAGFYFFRILPRIASALAGSSELYRELVLTTHAMGPAEHLASIVEDAGLQIRERHMMGFGLVSGIVAEKP